VGRRRDPKDPKLVATLVTLGPDGYVIETPDHHYTASRTGFESVAFRLGGTVVPVELFDLRLNRPDMVLAVRLCAAARSARVVREGAPQAAEEDGADGGRAAAGLSRADGAADGGRAAEHEGAALSLSVVAEDTRYKLDRLQVYVNDVPIHGSAGIDLRKQKTQRTSGRSIELLPGRNKIQVAALNSAGTESLKETVEVVSTATARPGKLYVLAVGVSRTPTCA
jgi:hypothetical protein